MIKLDAIYTSFLSPCYLQAIRPHGGAGPPPKYIPNPRAFPYSIITIRVHHRCPELQQESLTWFLPTVLVHSMQSPRICHGFFFFLNLFLLFTA